MLTNWRDCLAYDVGYVSCYQVGRQGSVVAFLDILNDLIPFTDKGSKFDSLSNWLSEAYYTERLITFGEYHDCLTALANNV